MTSYLRQDKSAGLRIMSPTGGPHTNYYRIGGSKLLGPVVVCTEWELHVDLNLVTNKLLKARYPVEIISTTATLDDTHEWLEADTSSGGFTWTLPPAASSGGKAYYIKNIGSPVNTLTVEGNASELVERGLNITLTTQDEAVVLMCNATQWRIY